MKKTFLFILISLFVVSASFAVYQYVYKPWRENKQERINLGLARVNFPYRDYSQDELNKMYPQVKNADVPTRVTPEEAYAKFRQGLKENNLEMVLEQLYKDSKMYDYHVTNITNAYNKNNFSSLYADYPEEISKSSTSDAFAEYSFFINFEGKNLLQSIQFIKNNEGDWKLNSI